MFDDSMSADRLAWIDRFIEQAMERFPILGRERIAEAAAAASQHARQIPPERAAEIYCLQAAAKILGETPPSH